MSSCIVKADKDHDLYCRWSNNVDGPTMIGTRAEMLADLTSHEMYSGQTDCRAISPAAAEELLAEADEWGTTARAMPCFAWDTNSPEIYAQRGWLYRRNLFAFLTALNTDEWAETGEAPPEALALLEPWEEDT